MTSDALATAIGESLGMRLCPRPAGRVHGGSINECYRWESDAGPLFVKLAPRRRPSARDVHDSSSGDPRDDSCDNSRDDAASSAIFEAEAAGLRELERAKAVRVPRVLGFGSRLGTAWLALEWIHSPTASVSVGGRGASAADARLGEQLAQQHRTSRPAFGWDRNNTIGSTPQLNDWDDNWVTFWRERRLRYQLHLAARNGHGGRLQHRGATLLSQLDDFFSSHHPVPSLLHGDLWGGNRTTDDQGQPVIFDPAVYYGDREADLAMTRLFGGFGADFYSAYEAVWPLAAGAAVRSDLYNLYHVLNHLNLFGTGYLHQAVSMIDGLLGELGR